MDGQLVNDYITACMAARTRELHEECNGLQARVNELNAAYQRKTEEIARLRQTIKKEQHLKQSALSKLAQLEIAGPSATVVSSVDHWLSTASGYGNQEKGTESAGSDSGHSVTASGGVTTVDHDLQRRLLELELQLVSKERESLTKHKRIIDHFEKIVDEKRQQIEAKENEIQRMKAELISNQMTIEQLRLEHGFTLRTAMSPSSYVSTVSSNK